MVIPSDDAIIKRRLLLEGESGLDDKRLALLLKDFLKWSSEDDSSDISAGAYQSMVEKIVQCENAMEQALLIQIMNIEQSNRYTKLLEDIDKSIEETRSQIDEYRECLKEARVIRKNRQEYHNLAKIVQEYPNRQETLQKINKMKRELSDLENINKKCDEKINLRKKQFHLFLVALHDLKKIVDQDGLLIDSSDHVTADLEETMDVS
uniref:THO complex subunit 7 homolog n=1 Tax=Mesocestoides corti TaxID=53468 RepID=A0A5K3F555_MESCO